MIPRPSCLHRSIAMRPGVPILFVKCPIAYLPKWIIFVVVDGLLAMSFGPGTKRMHSSVLPNGQSCRTTA